MTHDADAGSDLAASMASPEFRSFGDDVASNGSNGSNGTHGSNGSNGSNGTHGSNGSNGSKRRAGRPPKVDELGRPTRERLLAAGADALIEYGFEATRLSDVARAADVSPPAIYNHFADKDEFLVEVAKWSLERVGGSQPRSPFDPSGAVRRYLSPEFTDTRRLLLELHLAAVRHPNVGEPLRKWHTGRADVAAEAGAMPHAKTKALYLLLLGLCHVDSMADLGVDRDELLEQLDAMVSALTASVS